MLAERREAARTIGRMPTSAEGEPGAQAGPLAAASDGRARRGARSRRVVLGHAVDAASLDGLEGLSFGRLAEASGLSKAGIQTLFGTKTALQLATVATARDMFIEAVVAPAQSSAKGRTRLLHLIERWIDYAEEPLYAGGCFRVANLAEFDSKPGPVQAALFRDQQEWLGLIAAEITAAVDAGETPALDVDLAVFTLDAVLCAANVALRTGDRTAVRTVRRALDAIVPSFPPAPASGAPLKRARTRRAKP